MKKIEEILNNATDITPNPFIPNSFWRYEIEKVMKEYAEFYAKKCLNIAAAQSCANFECIDVVLGAENINPYVEIDSILNIQLPEHE